MTGRTAYLRNAPGEDAARRSRSEPSGSTAWKHGSTTLCLYDGDGNLARQLNANGAGQIDAYDAVPDQQTVTNEVTATGEILSSYVYQSDLDGRKTSDTETRLNNDGFTYTTTNIAWQYDAISHLTQET